MTLPAALPADTRMGPVALTVRDRRRLADWYGEVLGLVPLAEADDAVALGTAGGRPLVVLVQDANAVPPPRTGAGLYHLAILLPARSDLGRWLRHLSRRGLRLDGAADHLVSEATYLADPEGNGIEVYRDRPRAEWPTRAGRIHMDNSPFDLRGVVAEGDATGQDWTVAPDGTTMGHVHLKVADLDAARRFYVDGLGFAPTEEGYPSALFVAAGGYHHHLGLNTWESAGAPRRPGTTGLRTAVVELPPGEAAVARLAAIGVEATPDPHGSRVVDPSGNALLITDAPLAAGAALAL